jgi:predicted porin
MRGTESLGGGLNAIFQIESSISADNSGGTLAGRETFVGLQGGWGTVKLGYFLSPYDDIQSIFGSAPTLQTGILGSAALWSNTGYIGNTTDTGAFDDRVANSVRYDSPVVGGFNGSLQIGGRDVGGDGGNITQQRRHAVVYSMAGFYDNGPIRAGVAYEVHNFLREGTPANPKLDEWGLTVAGSYNFGVVKVGAAYERLDYDVSTGGNLRRDFWAVSATANLGPGQLYAAYMWAGEGKGSARCVTAGGVTTCPRVGGLTYGADTKSQLWEISYTYPLSKRTLLYTGYVMIDNEKNAGYNFHVNQISGVCTGNGAACGDSARPQGFSAGIVHFF